MEIIKSNFASLPTKFGNFLIKAYKYKNQEHFILLSKNYKSAKYLNVRIHSECLTGDIFSSLKCDCQNQLDLAIRFIAKEGGMIIYHRQEGRNIGLVNKINAYNLQDKGRNTIEANWELGFKDDERDYSIVKYILEDLNINNINLITNNPKKIDYICSLGININKIIPSITNINAYNENYLKTKKEHFGHYL